MPRSIRALLASVLGIAAFVPALFAVEPNRQQTQAVFVMTNDADRNQVLSFNREGDGRFSPGTSYYTGGRGSGGVNDPLESQGSLTLNSDHSLLFAINAGSGDVTVFHVRNGRLTFAISRSAEMDAISSA